MMKISELVREAVFLLLDVENVLRASIPGKLSDEDKKLVRGKISQCIKLLEEALKHVER